MRRITRTSVVAAVLFAVLIAICVAAILLSAPASFGEESAEGRYFEFDCGTETVLSDRFGEADRYVVATARTIAAYSASDAVRFDEEGYGTVYAIRYEDGIARSVRYVLYVRPHAEADEPQDEPSDEPTLPVPEPRVSAFAAATKCYVGCGLFLTVATEGFGEDASIRYTVSNGRIGYASDGSPYFFAEKEGDAEVTIVATDRSGRTAKTTIGFTAISRVPSLFIGNWVVRGGGIAYEDDRILLLSGGANVYRSLGDGRFAFDFGALTAELHAGGETVFLRGETAIFATREQLVVGSGGETRSYPRDGAYLRIEGEGVVTVASH